jgi:glycosyltransferase involved in cell wall biosynthesis
MLQYNFEIIPWPIWILIGIFCLSFFIQLIYYFYFYISVLVLARKTKKGKISFSRKQPGISVIICAKNESSNLSEFLPFILNQQYPDFEVIVVNDGSTDESEEILTELKKTYPQLYHTYVPQDTKVMSPKKLALTVGIKAAKNEYLLFTDADCKPSSENWIANMARNFTSQADFVLGYGSYEQQKGFLSHLISYDTFFIALQYMGFAYRGRPYMGVGRNMAYRKKLFFDMKGFASMLHLQSGDDDLFVNKAANKKNTQLEIHPESVTVSTIKENFRDWLIQKERHLSTASYYKNESKNLIGTEVMSRGLFYASFIGVLLYTDLTILLTAIAVFLVRYITQLLIINLSSKHFKERRFYLTIIVLDILLPLLSLFIFIRSIFSRRSKYQWK